MGKTICYSCEKELGRMSLKWQMKDLGKEGVVIPSGMTSDERVCNDCLTKLKEEEKNSNSEIKHEMKKQIDELITRSGEYKKQWTRDGIIQFKNDRIAILQRSWGRQVEFIVAFDDLTNEGYRLMAIDEGKTGSGSGLSGGVNAYFYFQKMDYVK